MEVLKNQENNRKLIIKIENNEFSKYYEDEKEKSLSNTNNVNSQNENTNNSMQIDINDKATIDSIALFSLKSYINELKKNKKELFNWYMYPDFNLKQSYLKVKDDEFEVDDFKNNIINEAISKIENSDNFIGKKSLFLLNVKFGEYNFDNNTFPLSLLNSESYITFRAKKYLSGIELSFDNANQENAFVKMTKEDAKNLIKSLKDAYGKIDRKLTAKYYFTIKDIYPYNIKTVLGQKEFQQYGGSNHYGYLKVIGHINKIEIFNNQNLLKTINYEDVKQTVLNTNSNNNNESKILIENCSNGDMKSCYNAAVSYLKTNPKKAEELYIKACNGGYSKSCTDLGYEYRLALFFTKKDIPNAKKYLKKGCDLGEQRACNGLILMKDE